MTPPDTEPDNRERSFFTGELANESDRREETQRTELSELLHKILSVLYDIQEDTSSSKWSLKEMSENK